MVHCRATRLYSIFDIQTYSEHKFCSSCFAYRSGVKKPNLDGLLRGDETRCEVLHRVLLQRRAFRGKWRSSRNYSYHNLTSLILRRWLLGAIVFKCFRVSRWPTGTSWSRWLVNYWKTHLYLKWGSLSITFGLLSTTTAGAAASWQGSSIYTP